MIYEFEPLTPAEQDIMLKTPALIAVLIAGADNVIDNRELKKAVELVHIKTFAEKPELQDYYKEVEKQLKQDIDDIITALPGDAQMRNAVITEELIKLNSILPRLKNKFAYNIYTSWKHFAHMVAQSWGGVMGLNNVSLHEKQWIGLPMITEPALLSSEE